MVQQLLWPQHAHHPPPRSLCLSRSDDDLLLPARAVQPESTFDLQHLARRLGDGAQPIHVRSRHRVRARWRHERLCARLHPPSIVLRQACEEEKLGDCETLSQYHFRQGHWVLTCLI